MKQIVLDAEAGQISAELARQGIAANTVVHARIDVVPDPELPMAAIARSGEAFDWLHDEPDLYSDDDLVAGRGKCSRSEGPPLSDFPSRTCPEISVGLLLLFVTTMIGGASLSSASSLPCRGRGPDIAQLAALPGTGLKVASAVRFEAPSIRAA